MSEKQHNPEKKYKGAEFTIPWHGEEYRFRPDNSQIFLHSERPEFDHFRLLKNGSIFRSQITNFQEMADYAIENGYNIVNEAHPEDDTYRVYVARFGEPELPPLAEHTPRIERKLAFARYAMDHMETVEDLFA